MSEHHPSASTEASAKHSSAGSSSVITLTTLWAISSRVSAQALRLLVGATFVLVAIAPVAAAPNGTATGTAAGAGSGGSAFLQVACGAGLGKLFTFVLTGAAAFVIAKGMITAVLGWDKTHSGSGSTQKEGREAMKNGATQIAGGIFTPPVLIGVLNVMGVNLGCLLPSIGIL